MPASPSLRPNRTSAEDLSSVERNRLEELRKRRLEAHMLNTPGLMSSTPPTGLRPTAQQARDPLDLHSGVDVEVLPEEAFSELFSTTDGG